MLILHFFFTFLQIDAIFSIFVYDFSVSSSLEQAVEESIKKATIII